MGDTGEGVFLQFRERTLALYLKFVFDWLTPSSDFAMTFKKFQESRDSNPGQLISKDELHSPVPAAFVAQLVAGRGFDSWPWVRMWKLHEIFLF